MKGSRRELSVDIVIHRGIFKNNHITLFLCFTFISRTRVSFHCKIVAKGTNVSETLTNILLKLSLPNLCRVVYTVLLVGACNNCRKK